MSFEWPEPCKHEGRKVRGLCRNCYARAWIASKKPEDTRPLLTCMRCGLQWKQKSINHMPHHCKRCKSPLWNIPMDGCPRGMSLYVLRNLIKIKTDECVLWPYGTSQGYSIVTVGASGHRQRQGHIVSWEITNKRKTPRGMDICHTCDVRLCINPRHLFIGTRQDNVDDAVKKMRHQHGSKHSNAQINEDIVKEIRAMQGIRTVDMARIFGVTEEVIYQVRTRKTWRHVA